MMADEEEAPTPTSVFAEAVAQLGDLYAVLPSATAGYREQLIQAGFNETAAEMMAMQYHQALLMHITQAAQ